MALHLPPRLWHAVSQSVWRERLSLAVLSLAVLSLAVVSLAVASLAVASLTVASCINEI